MYIKHGPRNLSKGWNLNKILILLCGSLSTDLERKWTRRVDPSDLPGFRRSALYCDTNWQRPPWRNLSQVMCIVSSPFSLVTLLSWELKLSWCITISFLWQMGRELFCFVFFFQRYKKYSLFWFLFWLFRDHQQFGRWRLARAEKYVYITAGQPERNSICLKPGFFFFKWSSLICCSQPPQGSRACRLGGNNNSINQMLIVFQALPSVNAFMTFIPYNN